MAGETQITIVGNLTRDVELRFTPSGAPVATFTVAATPRVFDKQANRWRDGEGLFLQCSAWREMAENVAETLTKGVRVIVTGQLVQRSYQTQQGDKRTVFELKVEEVGPSLRYSTALVQRKQHRASPGNFNDQQPQAYDPWAQPDPGPAAQQPPF